MIRRALLTSLLIFTAACGGQALPSRTLTTSQALTGTSEWLEFESVQVRQELLKDVLRQSQAESGRTGAVLFPLLQNGSLVAAPALETTADLLQAPDAGAPLVIEFDRAGERFAEDRRDGLQGLSEREAAELVARSLVARWNLSVDRLTVTRAAGAPWAAAYMDGVLRLNPAFVALAATPAQN